MSEGGLIETGEGLEVLGDDPARDVETVTAFFLPAESGELSPRILA